MRKLALTRGEHFCPPIGQGNTGEHLPINDHLPGGNTPGEHLGNRSRGMWGTPTVPLGTGGDPTQRGEQGAAIVNREWLDILLVIAIAVLSIWAIFIYQRSRYQEELDSLKPNRELMKELSRYSGQDDDT